MAPAAVGTVVVTGILVAGLALYLIMINLSLHRISTSLDSVYGAVCGITNQLQPAPGVVESIATDVGAVQGALHGLLELATGDLPHAAPPPVPAAVAAPVPAAVAAAAPPTEPEPVGAAGKPTFRTSKPNLPPPVHRRH